MNWTALGSIGEVLGAAAVVVTLIYLAAQIRQNTRATLAHATASIALFVRTAESHVVQSDLGSVSGDHAEAFVPILRRFVQSPMLKGSLQDMVDRKMQSGTFREWVTKNVLVEGGESDLAELDKSQSPSV